MAAARWIPRLGLLSLLTLAVVSPQPVSARLAPFNGAGATFGHIHLFVTDIEVPGIWVGRLVLENLDGDGAPAGLEHNAYQLLTVADGTRRIAVSTPLDAYKPQ